MNSAAAPSTPPSVALVARLHVDLCRCASATCRP
ncbi:putative leader peptide [Streptomyces sp. enrichment culture]